MYSGETTAIVKVQHVSLIPETPVASLHSHSLAPGATDLLSAPPSGFARMSERWLTQDEDVLVWLPSLGTLLLRSVQLVFVSWVPRCGLSCGFATIGLSIHPAVTLGIDSVCLILSQLPGAAVAKYHRREG